MDHARHFAQAVAVDPAREQIEREGLRTALGLIIMPSEEFKIKLTADTKGVVSGVNSAVESVQSLIGGFGKLSSFLKGSAIGAAAVAVGGFLEKAASDVLEKVKQLKNEMAETGLDPAKLQAMAKTFEAVGLNAGDGAKAMEHLAEAVTKIKDGEDKDFKLSHQLADLRVSLDAIKRGDYKQIFFEIAQAMKGLDLDERTVTALKSILGKGGVSMMPAFKRGLDNPMSLFGNLDDQDIADAARYNRLKSQNSFSKKIDALKNEVGLRWLRTKLGVYDRLDDLFGGEGAQSEALAGQRSKDEARIAQREQDKARHQADAAELKALRDKNSEKEKELRLSQMTTKQKEAALRAEMASLDAQIKGVPDDIEREKLLAKRLELESKLTTGRANAHNLSIDRHTDQLARMGLFVGGSGSPELSELRKLTNEIQNQRASHAQEISNLQRIVTELQGVRRDIKSD